MRKLHLVFNSLLLNPFIGFKSKINANSLKSHAAFCCICILTFSSKTLLAQIGPMHLNGGMVESATNNDMLIGGLPPLLPNAKLGVLYCPNSNKPGLLVTQSYCGPVVNVYNFDPGFSVASFDGIIQPGDGLSTPPVPNNQVVTNPNISFDLLGYGVGPTMSNQHPLIWARTENDPLMLGSVSGIHTTQFMVTPYGRSGFNVENPRATVDIKTLGGLNFPALILGRQRIGSADKTQHIQFIPYVSQQGYNLISQQGDQGLFFTDGGGTNGANQSGAFVLAPWSETGTDAGGLRMDNMGNVELRGDLRTTKVTVDTKWWPDFVFSTHYYLRPLSQVKEFITQNGHLPGMPSEKEVKEKGQNMGELQKMQQLKIEELTLYTIAQEEKIEKLEEKLIKLERLVNKLTK